MELDVLAAESTLLTATVVTGVTVTTGSQWNQELQGKRVWQSNFLLNSFLLEQLYSPHFRRLFLPLSSQGTILQHRLKSQAPRQAITLIHSSLCSTWYSNKASFSLPLSLTPLPPYKYVHVIFLEVSARKKVHPLNQYVCRHWD